jgi:hypothetical protein
MRRALTSLLLALLSFPLIAPILFANTASDLPACCRRDGKHHCAMMDMGITQDDGGVYWKSKPQKCSQYPKTGASLCSGKSVPQRSSEIGPLVFSHPTLAAQTEILYRISHSRSREKRGPPIPS